MAGYGDSPYMILFFPFVALVVISFLYREDLGLRALLVYWGIWVVGLVVMLVFHLSLGVLLVLQCILAIAMLIHVRANPEIPLR